MTDLFGFRYALLLFSGQWQAMDLFRAASMAMTTLPNKSPEPTAVGAVSSAIAVHAASRRWLSFFR